MAIDQFFLHPKREIRNGGLKHRKETMKTSLLYSQPHANTCEPVCCVNPLEPPYLCCRSYFVTDEVEFM